MIDAGSTETVFRMRNNIMVTKEKMIVEVPKKVRDRLDVIIMFGEMTQDIQEQMMRREYHD